MIDGIVYVRDELLYYDRTFIHVLGGEGYPLEAQDAAILEAIYRGESRLDLLCERLTREGIGPAPGDVESALLPVLRHPRSLLELRPPCPVVDPEVIVCDFNPHAGLVRTAGLVRRLRRRHRVLYLGLDDKVRGPLAANLAPKRAVEAKRFPGWFAFAQWARAVIRGHPEALLVLTGPQDAILFGDLARSVPTVIAVDASLPSTTSPGDLLGDSWIPDDPLDSLRELFYALRFQPLEELHELARETSSALARLEGYALRHAALALFTHADQERFLVELGRAPESCLPLFDPEPWPAGEDGPPTALVVAGLEEGAQPLGPLLELLQRAMLARRPSSRVAVLTGAGLFLLLPVKSGGKLVPWEDPWPAPPSIVAAFLVPGLLRDLRPAFRALDAGLPCLVVPTKRDHLLQRTAPETLRLASATGESLAALLARLLDPGDPLGAELARAAARWTRPWRISRVVAKALRARITPPSSAAAARSRSPRPS